MRQKLQQAAGASSPGVAQKEKPREYTDTLKAGKKSSNFSWFGSNRKKKKQRDALADEKGSAK